MHNFSGKFESKRQLCSLKRGSELNMDFGLRGRECEVGDWSHIARDRGHWCVNGNKRSGYTKGGKILNQLSDFQLIK
jgi:hypothetical protein